MDKPYQKLIGFINSKGDFHNLGEQEVWREVTLSREEKVSKHIWIKKNNNQAKVSDDGQTFASVAIDNLQEIEKNDQKVVDILNSELKQDGIKLFLNKPKEYRSKDDYNKITEWW